MTHEPFPRSVACVFFDAGETLLRAYPSFAGRFMQVAQAHGEGFEQASIEAALADAARRAEWPTDWTDPATQRSFWHGFYLDALEGLGHEGDRLALVEALLAAFSDPAAYKLFPDARPALEALAARGLKLGVISNFEPWLADVLELEGVAHLFAAITISGVVGIAKPDPGIFHAALAEAGVEAAASVHVGDQLEADVMGARRVGMTPVLIDRRGRGPVPDGFHRIERLTDLVGLLA